MRAMQRLTDVDVAEAGDDALIEQRCLQRRLLAGASGCERCRVELIAERFRTEPAQQRLAVERVTRNDLHEAEAPRVVEQNDRPGRHVKQDVVIRTLSAS